MFSCVVYKMVPKPRFSVHLSLGIRIEEMGFSLLKIFPMRSSGGDEESKKEKEEKKEKVIKESKQQHQKKKSNLDEAVRLAPSFPFHSRPGLR